MHTFELRPNCSLTPRSAALFYLSIVTVCLATAGSFAMAGLWPVLPFAGLELLLLGAALAVSMRRGRARELIQVDERDVIVRKSAGREQVEMRFASPWTQVRLQTSPVRTWPSRLMLRSMGRGVEVGRFLTEDERRALNARLSQVIPPR